MKSLEIISKASDNNYEARMSAKPSVWCDDGDVYKLCLNSQG